MKGVVIISILFAIPIVVMFAVFAFTSRRRKNVGERLVHFAMRSGWQDVTLGSFLYFGVKGMWNGVPVRAQYMARKKSVPERVVVTFLAPMPARLIAKRRFAGFFSNRPIVLFGPPLVEVGRGDLWVRSDERSFVDRVFANSGNAEAMNANLIDRFDEVRADRKGIRITRALDGREVLAHFGKAGFGIRRFDPQILDQNLNDAWRLVQGMAAVLPRPNAAAAWTSLRRTP